MARLGRMWLPLDVNFMDDPKVLRAGEQAGWLYIAMCLLCKRIESDGVLEAVQVDRLGVPQANKRLQALVREELVVQIPDGRYAIAAWLEHNESADDLAARRRKDANRKRGIRGEGGAA